MDLSRSGLKDSIKAYHNSDTTIEVEWYYVPEDAPCFPGLHSFALGRWDDEDLWEPPGDGEVGCCKRPGPFSRGLTPQLFTSPSHFCGDAQKMIDGFDVNVDAPLIETVDGLPLCCNPSFGFALGLT